MTGHALLPAADPSAPETRRPWPFNRRLRRLFARRLARDQRGVAAVEFGFIAPIMLLMLVGIVDISNAVSLNWRMVQLNRTLADLTSQVASVSSADITNIFAAAAATMSPYRGPAPRMSIYNVTINHAGIATVCWNSNSVAHSVTGWAVGTTVTLPDPAMAVPNTSFIVTAVDLTFDGIISPNFDMKAKPLFFRPRQGSRLGPNNIEQVGQIQNDVARTNLGC